MGLLQNSILNDTGHQTIPYQYFSFSYWEWYGILEGKLDWKLVPGLNKSITSNILAISFSGPQLPHLAQRALDYSSLQL